MEEKVRVTTDEESRSRSRGRKVVKDKRLRSKNSKKMDRLVKDLGKLLKRAPTPHSPAGDTNSEDSHTTDGGSASETIQLVTCWASPGPETGGCSPDRSNSPHPRALSPEANKKKNKEDKDFWEWIGKSNSDEETDAGSEVDAGMQEKCLRKELSGINKDIEEINQLCKEQRKRIDEEKQRFDFRLRWARKLQGEGLETRAGSQVGKEVMCQEGAASGGRTLPPYLPPPLLHSESSQVTGDKKGEEGRRNGTGRDMPDYE